MKSENEDDIVQRVKDFLDTTEDIQPTDLYDLLFAYRNSMHPDRFHEDSQKSTAEERFKVANTLLHDLRLFIEHRSLVVTPKDLIPLQREYELIRARDDSIRKDEEIQEIKRDLELAKWEVAQLKKRLETLGAQKIRETRTELIRKRGPHAVHATTAAIGVVLTASWATISQFSDFLRRIRELLPLNAVWLDWLFALLLVGSLLWFLRQLVQKHRLKCFLEIASLGKITLQFQNFLVERKKLRKFTESDVSEFIEDRFASRRIWQRLLENRTKDPLILEQIKDFFIVTLLGRELIERVGAYGMLPEYSPVGWYSLAREEEEEEKEEEEEEEKEEEESHKDTAE